MGASAPLMLDLQATPRVNQLSGMDLHMLQSGMLGQSSSMLDLQASQFAAGQLAAQGTGQFPCAGSGMLVGTVAALQQESGQLRSQWKTDVARLERELGQLRNAATWALPQLAEAQRQSRTDSNLQGLVLPGPSHGSNAQALQQAIAMQNAAATMSQQQQQQELMSQLVAAQQQQDAAATLSRQQDLMSQIAAAQQQQDAAAAMSQQQDMMSQLVAAQQQRLPQEASAHASDRNELLARIADLERQRDQALQLGRMGSAASECSSVPDSNNNNRARAGYNSTSNYNDQSSMNLTEALLVQMRDSHAAADTQVPPLSRKLNFDALAGSMVGPAATAMAQTDQQRASWSCASMPATPRMPAMNLQDALAGTIGSNIGSVATAMASVPEEHNQTVSAQTEVYQELENMEIELRKIRDENNRLKEEKDVCEAAHGRDVSTLEAMLAQIMAENQRLTKAVSEADALLSSAGDRKVNSINKFDDKIANSKKMDGDPISQSVHSVRSMAEPALEPDIEFDRSPYKHAIAIGAR